MACYILVVECVLLSHEPYFSHFDSSEVMTACHSISLGSSNVIHVPINVAVQPCAYMYVLPRIMQDYWL